MATANNSPITIKEVFNLTRFKIDKKFINSTHVTIGSDKYICVRETTPGNIVLIDVTGKQTKPASRINIEADSALVNPNSEFLAVKAKVESRDELKILSMDGNKLKSHMMPEQIVFWKWITPNILGLVTRTEIYHWSIEGEKPPLKMFNRPCRKLSNNDIIDYHFEPSQRLLVLNKTVRRAAEKALPPAGRTLQFFNVEYCKPPKKAASSAQNHNKVPKQKKLSLLLSLTRNPSDCVHDHPIAMQMSHKNMLILVITKLGQLFVYDLETATEVIYQEKFSQLPILLTIDASSLGWFYAIDEQGQVFLATINIKKIVRTYFGRQVCKLSSSPAAQDFSDHPIDIDRSYVVSKCKLSDKMETTPLSSRWDGDRLIEEYQTYIRDVTDDLGILESTYKITRGRLNANLIGIDGFNRARILEVQNYSDHHWSTQSSSLRDQLKMGLILKIVGKADGAKIELHHFLSELNKAFAYQTVFYHPFYYASLERFYFPIGVISLIRRQLRKDYVTQYFPTWEDAFRSCMSNHEVINIESKITNSDLTCSKLFEKVFKNRRADYRNDLLGVLKFMRNAAVHAVDFSTVDKCIVERDLSKLFPDALVKIYMVLVDLGLDLRKLSRKR
ncbi:hypothetical protein M0R45_000695 [Rubus argutus]|uniref:Uncharacterized protein n=1 Tax=Rubus argutus TaxID=59490 RepID=A0AAW1VL57_RUBAR